MLFRSLGASFITSLFSQKNTERLYLHLNAHTFYGYYSGNLHHSSRLNFLPAFSVAVIPEFRITRKFSLVSGAEWFSHGTKFSSYYFKSGAPAIYDKNFDFGYSLRWNEMVFPILFRSFFEGKMRDRYKYFFDAGPAMRFVLPAACIVTDVSGKTIFNAKVVTQLIPSAKNKIGRAHV